MNLLHHLKNIDDDATIDVGQDTFPAKPLLETLSLLSVVRDLASIGNPITLKFVDSTPDAPNVISSAVGPGGADIFLNRTRILNVTEGLD